MAIFRTSQTAAKKPICHDRWPSAARGVQLCTRLVRGVSLAHEQDNRSDGQEEVHSGGGRNTGCRAYLYEIWRTFSDDSFEFEYSMRDVEQYQEPPALAALRVNVPTSPSAIRFVQSELRTLVPRLT